MKSTTVRFIQFDEAERKKKGGMKDVPHKEINKLLQEM